MCRYVVKTYSNNFLLKILECLEENLSHLETQCQKVVFQIEQHDFRDSSTDYTLLNSCKEMIKAYCKGDITKALVCLKVTNTGFWDIVSGGSEGVIPSPLSNSDPKKVNFIKKK